MNYIEVKFNNSEEMNDIILAFLSDSDFEMFEGHEKGLNAFIRQEKYSEQELKSLISQIPDSDKIKYEVNLIECKNWNKEWESNFEPVYFANSVQIRAPFHEKKNGFKHDIVIEPKMSFGTGHHPTTMLMIELMMEQKFDSKTVLDMGCGSGILAILAAQLGSTNITAIDFDEWAFENCIENCQRNSYPNIQVKLGNASLLGNEKYDVILANINRNILLADTSKYTECLTGKGYLLQSGFLIEDEKLLIDNAANSGLKHIKTVNKEKWSALLFQAVN